MLGALGLSFSTNPVSCVETLSAGLCPTALTNSRPNGWARQPKSGLFGLKKVPKTGKKSAKNSGTFLALFWAFSNFVVLFLSFHDYQRSSSPNELGPTMEKNQIWFAQKSFPHCYRPLWVIERRSVWDLQISKTCFQK